MDKNSPKRESFKQAAAVGSKPIFLALTDRLMADMPERSRDILRKRYGLKSAEKETLEKIGEDYGITRERVRQIISEALKGIAKKSDHEDFQKAEEMIVETIKSNHGILKESDIVEKFNSDGPKEANAIRFFASCSKRIFELEEKGVLERSWVISKDTAAEVRKVLTEAENVLKKEKDLLTDAEMTEKLSRMTKISKQETASFLKVSSVIKKNKFGKWGLFDWTEVNPKGTREKVYLVLKEEKKPLHFTEIAKLIDRYGLGKRKAHPQTVHNELIKDDRFVLIGRGIYALREWGYFEGTIREVLEKILEKSRKPLPKDEIIKEVMKMRKVKKTTVMINLNNSRVFARQKDRYWIKK